MIFTQYYLDCLSQASYLIGDEAAGRAILVDPRRDVDEYVTDAEAAGVHIELVIETHVHADFVSGHLELAKATGAQIAYGQAAKTDFPIRRLGDGEEISLGEVKLVVLATPGHTPESICLVVYEHADDEIPYGVLTGDSLFIGDVGRPDLAVTAGLSPAYMAGQLFESLRNKILPLPDATRVYPAHGAGSACGKNISTATHSTLGQERSENYALAITNRQDFVEAITEGQPAAAAYFSHDAYMNRSQRELLAELQAPIPLDLPRVLRLQIEGATVLDTRTPLDFAAGHLIGALNVGLEGRFAETVGNFVDASTPIVLVCQPGTELEARIRLGRIGFDKIAGYLAQPDTVMAPHPDLVQQSSRLTANELQGLLSSEEELVVVDVRTPGEVDQGAVTGSVHIPLNSLVKEWSQLDPTKPTVIYCGSGYRSSVAASWLKTHGFQDISDLLGGFAAWQAHD